MLKKRAVGLMTFVNDVAGFDLVDDFGIVIVQRAAAFVTVFNGRVKASLFDVPLCNFQMLINVHLIFPVIWLAKFKWYEFFIRYRLRFWDQ